MEYYSVELDPVLVSIAIIVILAITVLLIFYYIPRIDEITRLQKENKKLKLQVTKLSEELSIELKDKMDIYYDYVEELSKKDGRIKQAEERAKTFCEYAESLKKED